MDLKVEAEADRRREDIDEPLHLDLEKTPGLEFSSPEHRRKPATLVERKLRLEVHKWHVLCLLAHLQRRNYWCDDEKVQAILKPLILRKTVRLLHLDSSQSQYQRNHSFNAAIDEISKLWRSKWTITQQGMRKAYWKEEPDELDDLDDLPDPVDMEDFRDAAKKRSGSRDLGAQLFCSLLRAVAVDTRLVCSLQPLSFSGVAKGTSPGKPKPQYIMASSFGQQSQKDQNKQNSTPSNPRWRLYGAEPEPSAPTPSKRPMKKIQDSPYPIFWAEVFNEALQKWIPVDPLVRNTINKPKTGFEPPANDTLNNMSYVVAFEDDGSAKDITRRYVQFYNGKTRRNRVESTKGGMEWWKRTMTFFEKPFSEDRDEIENVELLAREEGEQMPKNVQDFKNHPYYALERHLRRNEVIHPKKEIGRVNVGQSRGAKLEPVFRRKDVLIVKTADQWYRLGRDVKIGEQPLKRAISQKKRSMPVQGEEDDEGEEGAMMYAESQTQLYIPPSVVNGKIPRNAYGNLDVYVPSMIPAGAIHVRHPDAARAAKILGINYVDAVTGFEFKGRQGTAVLNGIVAAAEYRETLTEVIEAIAYERAVANTEKRSVAALQMWKRFLTALRIRERVHTKYAEAGSEVEGKGEREGEDEDSDMEDETYQNDDEVDTDEGGGGFFPEQSRASLTNPLSPETEPEPAEGRDIFDLGPPTVIEIPIVIHESPHTQSQLPPSPKSKHRSTPEDPAAGGFLPDHTCSPEARGGGFLMDDDGDYQSIGVRAKASPSSRFSPSSPPPSTRNTHALTISNSTPSNTTGIAAPEELELQVSELEPPPHFPPLPPQHPETTLTNPAAAAQPHDDDDHKTSTVPPRPRQSRQPLRPNLPPVPRPRRRRRRAGLVGGCSGGVGLRGNFLGGVWERGGELWLRGKGE